MQLYGLPCNSEAMRKSCLAPSCFNAAGYAHFKLTGHYLLTGGQFFNCSFQLLIAYPAMHGCLLLIPALLPPPPPPPPLLLSRKKVCNCTVSLADLGCLTLQLPAGAKGAAAAAAAAGRKAPAGKTAKILGENEALNLRSKAAYNLSQRQGPNRPALKRCLHSLCWQLALSEYNCSFWTVTSKLQ